MKKAYYLIMAIFCAEASLKAMLPSRSFQGLRNMSLTTIQRQTLSPALLNKNRLFSAGQPSQVSPKSWKAWFSQLFNTATLSKATVQKKLENQKELLETLKVQTEEIQDTFDTILRIERRNQPSDIPAIIHLKEILKTNRAEAEKTRRQFYKNSEIIEKQNLQQKNVDREAHE